jgi:hypothetical protein
MVNALQPLPSRLAGLGVLALGLSWSLGIFLVEYDQVAQVGVSLPSAFALVSLGGMLTVAAVWFGIGAVAWAMGRLLGGKAGLGAVLFSISAAAPPLWIATPTAILASGIDPLVLRTVLLVVSAIAGLAFLALAVAQLGKAEGFSWGRACGCAALTAIFCISFLSLYA